MSIDPVSRPSPIPLKVAVVESDPAHAELTALALEREGHEVRCAIDDTGLGEILEVFDADVIVSEWMLGRSDGRAVLRRAAAEERRRARGLPVVFVTGEEPETVHAASGSRRPVVSKPLRLETLREAVRVAVGAGVLAPEHERNVPLRGK